MINAPFARRTNTKLSNFFSIVMFRLNFGIFRVSSGTFKQKHAHCIGLMLHLGSSIIRFGHPCSTLTCGQFRIFHYFNPSWDLRCLGMYLQLGPDLVFKLKGERHKIEKLNVMTLEIHICSLIFRLRCNMELIIVFFLDVILTFLVCVTSLMWFCLVYFVAKVSLCVFYFVPRW